MSISEKTVEADSRDTTSLDEEESIPPLKAEETEEETDDNGEYLSGLKLGLVMLGLCMSVFLVGLDNAILATAVPTITTVFNSLDDVGWYGSAFLISVCALQPLSGKLYQHFSLKWTYLFFVTLFEVGSLMCATAVNSPMLIVGRAIAGSGAAGLFSGALVILAYSVALRQRPIYTGLISSMFGVSNTVGPILGGVFTQQLSWRWCFYINLPLGAVTVITLLFFFKPKGGSTSGLPTIEKFKHLDLQGLALFVPSVVMLLLAVQWGGNKYPWKSAAIIGLIFGFAILMTLFAIWQWRQQDEASIPPRIVGQRSVFSAAAVVFFGLGSVQVMAYYIPMWFQVINDNSPVKSGIRFLPAVLGNLVMSIVAGGLVTKFGHFNPWLFVGAVFVAVSGGVISSWTVDTHSPMINGILTLGGMGSSCVIQMPIIGLMALLPQSDLPTATSTIVFFQFFGGAIFLAISENILVSRLLSALHQYAPAVNAAEVVQAGAEGLRKVVTDTADLEGAIFAYNVAITNTFYLCVAGAVAAFFCGFGMEWRSVKEKQRRS